jgi:hypothetical protein
VRRYMTERKKNPATAMSLTRDLRTPGSRDARGRYGGGLDVFRGGSAKCIAGGGARGVVPRPRSRPMRGD